MVGLIISIVLALYLMVTGVMQIAKGKMSGMSEEEYTPESIKLYSRVSGVIFVLSSLPMILLALINVTREDSEFNLSESLPFIASLPDSFIPGCWIVFGVLVVLSFVLYPILVKKIKK